MPSRCRAEQSDNKKLIIALTALSLYVDLNNNKNVSTKGNNFCDFLFAVLVDEAVPKCGLLLVEVLFRPIALRKAKIVYNFGLSECSRVKFLENVNSTL